jgi:hypothetical protein
MRKLLLLLAFILASFSMNAQDSKFYAGVGVGYATAGGEALEGVNGGLSLNFLNLGLRLNETFGITANLSSTGHTIEDVDDVAVGIGTFSIGPMISFSLSDNVSWDLKPQYAFSMKAVFADDSGVVDDVELSGNAFIFGNSIVFGDGSSGFAFSVDLDYLSGKFTELEVLGDSVDIDDENKINNLKIGVGLRYNF